MREYASVNPQAFVSGIDMPSISAPAATLGTIQVAEAQHQPLRQHLEMKLLLQVAFREYPLIVPHGTGYRTQTQRTTRFVSRRFPHPEEQQDGRRRCAFPSNCSPLPALCCDDR